MKNIDQFRAAKHTGLILLLFVSPYLQAQNLGTIRDPHVLHPSVNTVAIGNYWSENKPALKMHSGEYIRVHTLITSSPERLEGAGVPPGQVEKELREVQAVKDRGPGGHILTGPVY